MRATSVLGLSVAASLTVWLWLTDRAEATTRRVAFANVARDGKAAARRIEALRAELAKQGSLALLPDGAARLALEEPVSAGDRPGAAAIASARARLAEARSSLERFDTDEALATLERAEQALAVAPPGPEVVRLLADVHLAAGLAHVAAGDEDEAIASFRIVRRLDPSRSSLSEAEYRPRVVELYAKAARGGGAPVSIQIGSEPAGATIWIDGRELGAAPVEVGVPPGRHYVAAALAGHETRAERVDVGRRSEPRLSFLLARLPAERRARDLRAWLVADPDGADWPAAAAELANVASVDLVVLVRDGDHDLEAAVFDARSSRLAPFDRADANTIAAALPPATSVPSAAEAARFAPDAPPPRERDRAPATPWYSSGWLWAGVALVAAVTVGGVLLLQRGEAGGAAECCFGP